MKTVFVCNSAEPWLQAGATHFGYKNIPDFDPVYCYTPADVTKWAETLGKFVRGLDEEYVLLMLDDYWVQDVDVELLSECEAMMELSSVDKVDVSGDRMQFPHIPWSGDTFVLSTYNAPYKTSLQAAIWRTEYLAMFCDSGWTPWDFEIEGSKRAVDISGYTLGVKKPCIRYINVLRRGEWYGKFDF